MRVRSFGTVAVATICALTGGVLAQQLDESPTGDTFLRRALGAAAILGDYLYIEGGEVSQEGYNTSITDGFSKPFNLTLSIPLNKGWKSSDLEFKEIDRGDKPPIKFSSLWARQETDQLFQYDGEGSKRNRTSAKERYFWMMQADGNGGGEWTTVDGPGDIEELERRAQSAAVVCGDIAYTLGGFVSPLTDDRMPDRFNKPALGMYEYNMKEDTWSNSSLDTMSPPNGVFIRGMAGCVEGLGDDKKYIFTTGGAVSSTESTDEGTRPLDPANVTFYDIEADRWMWQAASGEPPALGWNQHCQVGVKSESGTYDIYVYGGYDDDTYSLNNIWVLSLPAFHWTKVGKSRVPRGYHSCVVSGQRQMIVVGGINGWSYHDWAWAEKDEFGNGIGVFDLTTLEWRDEYDPDLKAYDAPDVVKEWYADGGMEDVEWSSDGVKNVFGSMKVNIASTSEPSESSSSNTPQETNTQEADSDEDSGGSSTPTAAIAGGVVGGVAGLAIIGGLIWFCCRRRRTRSPKPDPSGAPLPAEMAGDWSSQGGKKYYHQPELQGSPTSGELQGSGPFYTDQGQVAQYYEMPASNMDAHEMDGTGYPGFVRRG
ncbi:hypothetical protein CC79DRAFT_1384561 [Sarocladium strictum]